MTSIPTIASKLTTDERAALVNGRWNVGSMASKFIGIGLVRRISSRQHPLLNLEITPIGLSVRTHLQKEASK